MRVRFQLCRDHQSWRLHAPKIYDFTHPRNQTHLQADVIDMDLANGIAGMHALGTGSEETSMREIAIVCVALVLVVAILCTQTSVVDEKFLQEQKLEARRTR